MEPYQKIKRIYSGPYSDVFLGQSAAGGQVALKVVDSDIVIKPHSIKNEIAILKKFQNSSDNILPYIDDYTHSGDVILVTPYYNYNLHELLKAKYTRKVTVFNFADPSNNSIKFTNNISSSDAEKLLLGISSGLKFVHSHNIIHRDIKPANIYFKNEDITFPIIGDFGTSYDITKPNLNEPLDKKYTDICTGYYKPPELCFGVTNYSYEIDIWAFGILITIIYSKSFTSILDEFEIHNDLSLISALFTCFGTPYTKGPPSTRYWPTMDDGDKYHFKAFDFIDTKRKSLNKLLPTCENEKVIDLFNEITVYEGQNRLNSQAIWERLNEIVREQT